MSVSPELALAAAAAIGDKALEQQTNELIALRKQLHAAYEVEITGMMGTPIYARGSFQDGNFRETVGLSPPGVLWEVKLANEEEFEAGIPLRNFGTDNNIIMEIRLGGVVFATTRAVIGTNCRVRGAGSNTNRDDVFCPINSGEQNWRYNRVAWMAINFRSLPAGPWRHLQSVAAYNNSVTIDRLDDIFHKISHHTQIPGRLPGQSADVTSICFHAASVTKMIRNVYRPGDTEFEKEREKHL